MRWNPSRRSSRAPTFSYPNPGYSNSSRHNSAARVRYTSAPMTACCMPLPRRTDGALGLCAQHGDPQYVASGGHQLRRPAHQLRQWLAGHIGHLHCQLHRRGHGSLENHYCRRPECRRARILCAGYHRSYRTLACCGNSRRTKDANLGYSYGRPVITKKRTAPGWCWSFRLRQRTLSSDNATLNSPAGDGMGYLYVLNATTAASSARFPISTGVGTAATPSGLARFDAYSAVAGPTRRALFTVATCWATSGVSTSIPPPHRLRLQHWPILPV